MHTLTDEQWAQYKRDGYLNLGLLLEGDALTRMQTRLDDIMMGKADVDYDRMLMQLDFAATDYAKLGEQTQGFKGATLNYRKIEALEFDPLFLEYMQWPLFHNICERTYGTGAVVSCYRAMFMNKPAGRGSVLPWHQDRWAHLDRDPQVTVWTAVDPATMENGCMKIIPGSHKELLNPDHPAGFLSDEIVETRVNEEDGIFLELKAGEVALLHNWLLHSSDVNHSDRSRRAFSVCYMDGSSLTTDGQPAGYSTIFGAGALTTNDLKAARAG
jgi:phytanoyl-CoA hydroxylase